ncbi:hypothetical protein EYF80_022276 [Liparis tanakae]|uniref:Uncharacterized protein n=1 Tax=Liparis tanakae TaxID=230148 RepID=A0A4Z2HPF0_9TELE|nr:hypothetical protein EYF80_022276 [Liparis tanakae]
MSPETEEQMDRHAPANTFDRPLNTKIFILESNWMFMPSGGWTVDSETMLQESTQLPSRLWSRQAKHMSGPGPQQLSVAHFLSHGAEAQVADVELRNHNTAATPVPETPRWRRTKRKKEERLLRHALDETQPSLVTRLVKTTAATSIAGPFVSFQEKEKELESLELVRQVLTAILLFNPTGSKGGRLEREWAASTLTVFPPSPPIPFYRPSLNHAWKRRAEED